MKKEYIFIAFVVALILAIPLIAMQFTDQVVWKLNDFIVASILLLSTGVGFQYLMASGWSKRVKKIIGAVIVILFVLVWIELAVGVFGTPWAGS